MIINEKYFEYVQLEPCDGVRSIMDLIKAGGYSDNMTDDEREFYTAFLEWKENKANAVNDALVNAENKRKKRLEEMQKNLIEPSFVDCTPCEYEPASFSVATSASVSDSCEYEEKMINYMNKCNELLHDNKQAIYKDIWGENIDSKQNAEI